MLKLTQFSKRALGKISDFKNCSTDIEAGDFLNIFLRI